jgi:hypothetical protein
MGMSFAIFRVVAGLCVATPASIATQTSNVCLGAECRAHELVNRPQAQGVKDENSSLQLAQLRCPYGMHFCANARCCPNGTACTVQGCMQIGMDCGNNRFCPPGKKCARSGGCLDVNSLDCGGYACRAGTTCCNGQCCGPGNACTAGGCKQIGMQCDNVRFCTPGFKCSNGGGCVPINSIDCGNGHFCAIGKVCQGSNCADPYSPPPQQPQPQPRAENPVDQKTNGLHIPTNSNLAIALGIAFVGFVSWMSSFATKQLSGEKPNFLREATIASIAAVVSSCVLYPFGLIDEFKWLSAPLVGGLSVALLSSSRST